MENAKGEYTRARKLGLKQVDEALAASAFPYPHALDDVCDTWQSLSSRNLGTQEIPLHLIEGTVTRGRQRMFSCGFLPIAEAGTEFALKWEMLYEHQLSEGITDPIEVYEYLQRFYVQEGNKRVSVARYLDMAAIDAQLIRILPAPGTPEAQNYDEFLQFWQICPLYGFDFSKPGSYARLAKLLGRTLDDPWTDEQVKQLKSAFALFEQSYKATLSKPSMSAADAYLVYLQAFANANPLQVGEAALANRIRDIAGELKVAAQPEPIAYTSELPEAKGVMPSLKNTMRSVVKERPLHLAFIYDKSPKTSGWVALHELGRTTLSYELGEQVRTSAFTNCADDASFDAAVEQALKDKADLLVTVSPRQFEQTLRAAIAHPKDRFINCSIRLSSDAVRTYYARMYELKFVMGALAASLARNHKIGYLAVSPIYGSVSEVNAFALGASLIDPEATIYLEWVTSDALDWRHALQDAQVSVISGLDFSDPANDEKPCGLCTVDEQGKLHLAAMPVWDWSRYYALIVRAVRDDSWSKDAKAARNQARNYWPGLSSGVLRLQEAEFLSLGQHRLVATLTHAIEQGSLMPFDTKLLDQDGTVQRDFDDPPLSDKQLASMHWLAANVVGRLPRQEELSDDGRKAVEVSGVIPTSTNPEGD